MHATTPPIVLEVDGSVLSHTPPHWSPCLCAVGASGTDAMYSCMEVQLYCLVSVTCFQRKVKIEFNGSPGQECAPAESRVA